MNAPSRGLPALGRQAPGGGRRSSGPSDPLRSIPGVGPATATDLRALGITEVEALVGRDPEELYARLCAIQGGSSDRCNLYVYRCAVYFAEGGREPELLEWWSWSDAAVAARLDAGGPRDPGQPS